MLELELVREVVGEGVGVVDEVDVDEVSSSPVVVGDEDEVRVGSKEVEGLGLGGSGRTSVIGL